MSRRRYLRRRLLLYNYGYFYLLIALSLGSLFSWSDVEHSRNASGHHEGLGTLVENSRAFQTLATKPGATKCDDFTDYVHHVTKQFSSR